MGSLAIDPHRYARLLVKTLPRVIESEKEYGRTLSATESLMNKGEERSPEEDLLLKLMVSLIEAYEQKHYSLPDAGPREALIYLMEKQGLRQADLLPIFKSRGYISDVIRGKRAISKMHARGLAEFFHLPADVFI